MGLHDRIPFFYPVYLYLTGNLSQCHYCSLLKYSTHSPTTAVIIAIQRPGIELDTARIRDRIVNSQSL
jgi:hypothetical protein